MVSDKLNPLGNKVKQIQWSNYTIEDADPGYKSALLDWNTFVCAHIDYEFPLPAPQIIDFTKWFDDIEERILKSDHSKATVVSIIKDGREEMIAQVATVVFQRTGSLNAYYNDRISPATESLEQFKHELRKKYEAEVAAAKNRHDTELQIIRDAYNAAISPILAERDRHLEELNTLHVAYDNLIRGTVRAQKMTGALAGRVGFLNPNQYMTMATRDELGDISDEV